MLLLGLVVLKEWKAGTGVIDRVDSSCGAKTKDEVEGSVIGSNNEMLSVPNEVTKLSTPPEFI